MSFRSSRLQISECVAWTMVFRLFFLVFRLKWVIYLFLLLSTLMYYVFFNKDLLFIEYPIEQKKALIFLCYRKSNHSQLCSSRKLLTVIPRFSNCSRTYSVSCKTANRKCHPVEYGLLKRFF